MIFQLLDKCYVTKTYRIGSVTYLCRRDIRTVMSLLKPKVCSLKLKIAWGCRVLHGYKKICTEPPFLISLEIL